LDFSASAAVSTWESCNSKELKASPDLALIDGDISKKETAVKLAAAAIEHFGRIDLLINNAGIFIPKPFTEYTEDDYHSVMNTNPRALQESEASFRSRAICVLRAAGCRKSARILPEPNPALGHALPPVVRA
jgi:NAD(P)-dependent dehydrogenase (short-subunit alcohol dehydrogenase family)